MYIYVYIYCLQSLTILIYAVRRFQENRNDRIPISKIYQLIIIMTFNRSRAPINWMVNKTIIKLMEFVSEQLARNANKKPIFKRNLNTILSNDNF